MLLADGLSLEGPRRDGEQRLRDYGQKAFSEMEASGAAGRKWRQLWLWADTLDERRGLLGEGSLGGPAWARPCPQLSPEPPWGPAASTVGPLALSSLAQVSATPLGLSLSPQMASKASASPLTLRPSSSWWRGRPGWHTAC